MALLLHSLHDSPAPCRSQSTCSSSSLSLRSCDSSCLLWSSRICMRVSRRVLCCRRTRASARSSSSCCPSAVGEPGPPSPASVSMGTDAASSCFHLSLLYSPCSTLRSHRGQMEGKQSGPHVDAAYKTDAHDWTYLSGFTHRKAPTHNNEMFVSYIIRIIPPHANSNA